MGKKVQGTVKWFNATKGYGFINVPGEEKDIFVHHTGIRMEGFRHLEEGDAVEFTVVQGKKGPQAEQVMVVGG